jgi:4-hydroxy-2-oxoheptanedioate aldolase
MLPDPHLRSRLRCAPMSSDSVRRRWAAGETAFAAWLSLESPAAAAAVASAGFDAVVVDLQHGHATFADLPALSATLETSPAVPFVRSAWNHPADLMRSLDLGFRGVICPMVGSRAEADAFVAACRYPPVGTRSYGPIHGAFGRGRDHTRAAEEATLLFAMIETAEGLANLDEIASTPGLDGLFVGPADLSLGMGLDTFADLTDPPLLAALDTVIAAALAHDLVPGIHAPSAPDAAAMARRGFRFVSCMADEELLRDAAEVALRETRGAESHGAQRTRGSGGTE